MRTCICLGFTPIMVNSCALPINCISMDRVGSRTIWRRRPRYFMRGPMTYVMSLVYTFVCAVPLN